MGKFESLLIKDSDPELILKNQVSFILQLIETVKGDLTGEKRKTA